MFKKAKRRIVFSILAILCSVIIGTLSMIYLSSYLSVTSQNFKVLENRAEMMAGGEPGGAGELMPDDPGRPGDERGREGKIRRGAEVGTFYAVKLKDDGTWTVIENEADEVYTDDELISLAQRVSSKEKGNTGDLLYIVKSVNGETVVTFMDNTNFNESFYRLLLFTLLFGVIALILIAFISVRIADRIVSPMEETYEKQKQFTADAGHELKTPIAAVAANIELLSREIGENRWLENISYENERMRELVTELLELAKNENKTAERTVTDLSRLVNGAVLPFEASAFEKDILIETDIAEGITANIDAGSIGQLVSILVDNAVSHTSRTAGETGKISVSLTEKKGVSVLSVSNPGEEIPESEREKLFERFYRSDSSHEHTGHYGLGLAIAKAIADANGAEISVSCQDGLVTFTVEFPSK